MRKLGYKLFVKDLSTIQEESAYSSSTNRKPRFTRRRYRKVSKFDDENENERREETEHCETKIEDTNNDPVAEEHLPELPLRTRTTSGSSISSSSYKLLPPIGGR